MTLVQNSFPLSDFGTMMIYVYFEALLKFESRHLCYIVGTNGLSDITQKRIAMDLWPNF